jgi:hypothetical protein
LLPTGSGQGRKPSFRTGAVVSGTAEGTP